MAQCIAKTKDGSPCQISAPEGKKYCHVHSRQRFWRRFLSISTIGLIVIGVLSLIADITGIFGYLGINLPQSPAPLAFATASSNQTLIIVADFDDRSQSRYVGIDPAQYIYEQLLNQIRKDKLDIRIERLRIVVDDNSVRSIGETYGATLVLWGWYDALSITPRMERIKTSSEYYSTEESQHIGMTDPEKIEFSVITDLPSQTAYLTLFTLGLEKFEHGKYDRALLYFESALASIPANVAISTNPSETYVLLGDIYYFRFNYDKAFENFNRAIDLKPDFYLPYYSRAVTYQDTGDYEHAISDYGQAIKLEPDFVQAYNNRGYAYIEMGDYKNAIADFDKAIEIKPDFYEAYSNRGKVYDLEGDYSRAITEVNHAIKLRPDRTLGYYNRGTIYLHKQDYKSAVADFSKALDLNPDFAEAYLNRGSAYNFMSDFDSAISDFDNTIKLDPTRALAYFNRAIAYASKGEFEQALADLNNAIEYEPDYAEAYQVRGRVYADKGDFEQSISDFTRAIAINPEYYEAYFQRGITYYYMEDFENALTDYNIVLQSPEFSNDPFAYHNRGVIYKVKGEYELAITDFDQAIKLDSRYVQAYFDRADTHEKMGNKDKAIADYKMILKLTTDPQFMQEVEDRLKALGAK